MWFLDRLAFRRVRRALADRALAVDKMRVRDIRRARTDARSLRRDANELFRRTDDALRAPAPGAALPGLAARTEWAARNAALAGALFPAGYCPLEQATTLTPDFSVYHDGRHADLALRQVRTVSADGLSPFEIVCDCLAFDGTYLSFALALPEDAVAAISPHDLLRVHLTIEAERPVTAYGRLNIRHGPNTEEIVRDIDLRRPDSTLEYDLFYADMEADQISAVWVDLIFERPAMNRFALKEAVLSRRRRADV